MPVSQVSVRKGPIKPDGFPEVFRVFHLYEVRADWCPGSVAVTIVEIDRQRRTTSHMFQGPLGYGVTQAIKLLREEFPGHEVS